MSSSRLDSHLLLTVVLAGDQRLSERFRCDELAPLGSRIRVKLTLDCATPEELRECLVHALLLVPAPDRSTVRGNRNQEPHQKASACSSFWVISRVSTKRVCVRDHFLNDFRYFRDMNVIESQEGM